MEVGDVVQYVRKAHGCGAEIGVFYRIVQIYDTPACILGDLRTRKEIERGWCVHDQLKLLKPWHKDL